MTTPRIDGHADESVTADATREELARSNARLRVLSELSHHFSTSIDLSALLATIVRSVADLIGDGCSVVLLDERGEALTRAASAHRDAALDDAFKKVFEGVTIPKDLAKSVVATVARTGRPAYVPEVPPESMVERATDALKPLVRRLNIHSLLVVPLRGRAGILGALSLMRSGAGRSYTPDDLTLLGDVADRASLALQNAHLLEVTRAHSAELAEANAMLRQHAAVLEGISEAVVSFDAELRVRTWNRGAQEMFGWTFAEVLGKSMVELIAESEVDPSRDQILQQLRDEGTWSGERTQRNKQGAIVTAFITASALKDETGKVVVMMVIARDLEKQRETERATRQLASIVHSSTDAIVSETMAGVVQTWNRSAEQLFGYAAAEIIGRNVSCLLADEKREELERARLRARRGEHLPPLETVMLHRDGSRIDVSVTLSPILTTEGQPLGVSSIVRDIGERRKLEQQVIVSERLASVGMLAAGVAHEINNPLAYVRGNLELILRRVKESKGTSRPEDFAQLVDDARDGADRIARIVQGLQSFSRAERAPYVPLSLETVLETAVSLSQNELKHSARLTRDYRESPRVMGDEGRLVQVFVNLLVNAAHALKGSAPSDGNVRLCTRTDQQGRAIAEVTDSGSGIPESLREHVFDAFFTTKPVGTGTGLGLSISRNIIEAHGGEIGFESVIGKGTTFRVTMPAATARALTVPPHAPLEPESQSAVRGKVLVVDDEPMIGRYLAAVMSADHDVSSSTSASEVLERLRAGERFDMIVCDLMMPGLSGMGLYAALMSFAPEQAERMVFMTGGAFTAESKQFLDTVSNARLDKPFGAAKLRELSRALLVSRNAPRSS
jgi:PAS domain S-box-containing protein